jgi:hypothetical protein
MNEERIPLLPSSKKNEEQPKNERPRYSKKNNELCQKIWTLFCEIHDLDPNETKYEEVESDQRFHGIANLCWHTDICDILKYVEKHHFIIRRKTMMHVYK